MAEAGYAILGVKSSSPASLVDFKRGTVFIATTSFRENKIFDLIDSSVKLEIIIVYRNGFKRKDLCMFAPCTK